MSKSASFSSMKQAIRGFVKNSASQSKDTNQVQTGILKNDKVVIGGKTYRANILADMFYEDGEYVYCIVPDSGNEAAVVGKA